MRKIALMMSALAVCMAASGQNAQSTFFPEGTTWVEKTTNIIESTYRYDNYLVGGDTVIGGKDYNKLLINGRATGNCLREDSGKVYMYDISYSREFLLYDFDWSVGKELVFEYADPYVEPMRIAIGEIGQMRLSDGSMCDCLGYGDGGFLLRGIGFNDGVLTHAYMQPTNGDRKVLHSFTRDGVLLYKHKDDAFDCEEAYWISYINHGDTPGYLVQPSSMVVYRLQGDTVAFGETWQMMHSCYIQAKDIRTMHLDVRSLEYGAEGTIALIRKDGDKVFCVVLRPEGFFFETYVVPDTPFLLYDFGAESGETFYSAQTTFGSYEEGIGMVVTKEKKEFMGIERTVINDEFAEGIGCLICSPLGHLQMYTTGEDPHLLSCIVDGQLIYEDCPDYAPWLGGKEPCLKLWYDMIAPNSYSLTNGNAWIIGRVADGKVMSTYEISRQADVIYTDIFHSDLLPGQDLVITKPVILRDNSSFEAFPDLATITIDGVTRDLYDFSLGVGDTFDNGVVHLTVTAVDTAFIEGYERRILTMDSGEQWIDGIGSTRGLLASVTEPTDEYEEVMLSCRSGDVVMYENPVYGNGIAATASQNGAHIYAADGVLHVEMAAEGDYRIGIYDMAGTEVTTVAFTGQTLSHPLTGVPHGVYAVSVSDSNGNAVGHGKVVR